MALFFYRAFTIFYRLAIWLASPFNQKAKKALKGRRGIFKLITTSLKNNKAKIAWFHCASLGEFEQGRPIIERFKTEFPDYKVLLTFFSPSGYEVRKNYDKADFVYYLPWDSKSNAKKFVKLVNPSVAIFVKYEFWHFYIKELHSQSIPILSVSSIFRPDQIYFKAYGKFYLKILKRINFFFVQNRASKILLEKHGIENSKVAGDTRFDRVAEIVNNRKLLPQVEKFKGHSRVMVIGSCWPEDLDVLMSFMNESDMKFIIAPHEIEGECQKIVLNEGMRKTILYSNIEQLSGYEEVLLIDNIGLLSSLYGYGDYAYVGGAFGAGLHNILEAATYGIPIFFGNKNYQKFNEAIDLINLGGAVAIKDETELRHQFREFENEKALQIAGQVNRDYVKDNTGATDKIIDYCKTILKP
ncbi:3-deoxy-D-manno-octulosonic acid transferase [Fulvivirga lutea]|uniref:3-deoxy-D-manno-octulosonic acid transferase n=1 Tax=Fulvivirga lutea TaxID=2810512 RepID=A0A974WGY4_9BACT|nr:glycosyltransferase N-terminal domain-containing protein [Fulvivirga lutea]QSE97684.1 3-deoxy-D-manno-octulosonic acid transferase [Fulvivirga lutea]